MKKVRTLSQALADPRVESWSDERNGYNDGIWLYLKHPWRCPDTDLPVIHEYTVRDICDSLNRCHEALVRWEAP